MLAVIEWNNLIVEPVTQMLTRIMAYLPVLLGALNNSDSRLDCGQGNQTISRLAA